MRENLIATMSEEMPPVHSAPATMATLVPVVAGSPPSRRDGQHQHLTTEAVSSGSENSDHSDSEMSSSSQRSEDGSGCTAGTGGPPPLVRRDIVTSAAKVATCDSLPSSLAVGRPVPATAAAIPLSVLQTSNKDPVLTTAILPHCEHFAFARQLDSLLALSLAFWIINPSVHVISMLVRLCSVDALFIVYSDCQFASG